MFKSKKILLFISLFLVISLFLGGCQGGKNTSQEIEEELLIEQKIDDMREVEDGEISSIDKDFEEEQEKSVIQQQGEEQGIQAKVAAEKEKPNIDLEETQKKAVETKKKEEMNTTIEKKNKTVTISIKGPEDIGWILEETEIEIGGDETVLDILKKVTRANKIHMEFRGRKSTAYIEGIDNLYEFDRGSGSGWMYSINDKFPNRSAGIWPVAPGDRIKWLYTLDLGKDLGIDINEGLWDGKEE